MPENRALAEGCSIVSGRVLSRKRKGARVTIEQNQRKMACFGQFVEIFMDAKYFD